MRYLRSGLYAVVALVVAAAVANVFLPREPIGDRTALYEQRVYLSWGYPFLVPYYLLLPEAYDPARRYPLVLVLHGATKRAQAAYVLADPRLRERFAAVVVVPMAPFNRLWATPDLPGFERPWFPAIDLAVNVVNAVRDEVSVDARRIYVTGSSTGGFGAFAAPIAHPELFAAAIPVAGGWDPAEAAAFPDIAVWAWHDRDDDQVPFAYSSDMVSALRREGIDVRFSAVSGHGHAAWQAAYADSELWSWLFAQSR